MYNVSCIQYREVPVSGIIFCPAEMADIAEMLFALEILVCDPSGVAA